MDLRILSALTPFRVSGKKSDTPRFAGHEKLVSTGQSISADEVVISGKAVKQDAETPISE